MQRKIWFALLGAASRPRSWDMYALARTADPALAERRRQEILDAAVACFRRRGFHQTSMQQICAEAQLSAGAVYRYFPAKADIITAIAAQDREAVHIILADQMGAGRLVENLSRAAAVLIARFSGENAGALLAEVMAEAARDPALCARLAAIDADARQTLAEAIAEAQRAGVVDAALDPADSANLLFAALDGLALRLALFRTGDEASVLEAFQALAARYLAPQHENRLATQREAV